MEQWHPEVRLLRSRAAQERAAATGPLAAGHAVRHPYWKACCSVSSGNMVWLSLEKCSIAFLECAEHSSNLIVEYLVDTIFLFLFCVESVILYLSISAIL